jgi:parallel beta-helix repeat protein
VAAPVVLIPVDAATLTALTARTALTGDVHWKIEIDPDGGGYHDYTSNLDNNQVTITAKSSVLKPAEATQASFSFRNSPKVWSEGSLANCPVKIWVSIGAGAYFQVFFGYVSPQGCTRAKKHLVDDKITVTAYDSAKYRGLQRKVKATAYLGYDICDLVDTAGSLAHALAAAMGLAIPAGVEFYSLPYTKDYLGLDGKSTAWRELQDLAMHYGALLGFRYDGVLRLLVWTSVEWAAAAPEYTFDSTNVHEWSAVGGEISCNVAKTEFSKYYALPAGSICYKNYDQWNEASQTNAIVVAAGEYWPGGTDDLALARLNYQYGKEKYPIATAIITPTIGAVGSGSDIECSGGVVHINSFNGSTADTKQNLDSSEIILHNATGGAVTITKMELRGTPLREIKKLSIEHIDATVANDWDRVEAEIPGKYGTDSTMGKIICRRWVDFGHEPRKEFDVLADFTPHLQCGAIVHLHPSVDVDLDCYVESYTHTSRGPHSRTRTRVRLVERIDWNPTGAGVATHEFIDDNFSPLDIYIIGAATYSGERVVNCDGVADDVEINAGVAAMVAKGGGTVRVVGGVFNTAAAVVLDDHITLEIAPGATIKKNGNFNAVECIGTAGTHKHDVGITGGGTITRDATDTNVKNLISAIYVDNLRLTIASIRDPYSLGINIFGCTGYCRTVDVNGVGGDIDYNTYGIFVMTSDHFQIEGNTVSDLTSPVVGKIKIGILYNGNGGIITNNTVRNMGLAGADKVGIYISGGADCKIQSNKIFECSDIGIKILNTASRSMVQNNLCLDNGNLIDHGDCETTGAGNDPHITGDGGSLSNATFARSAAQKYAGTYSYLFTKTVAAGTAAYAWLVDNNTTTDMHGLSIKQGSYKLKAQVYVPAGGMDHAEVNLIVSQYYGGAWNDTLVACADSYDAFQAVEVTMTMNAACTGTRVGFAALAAAENTETAHFDNIQFIPMGVANEHQNNFYDAGTDTQLG